MGMIMMEYFDDPNPVQFPRGHTNGPVLVYTPEEVAALFRVNKTTVIGWCRVPEKAEKLGAFKPGGSWRFRADTLHTYLKRVGISGDVPAATEVAEMPVDDTQTGNSGGEETA